jgi:hypothetical protein
MTAQCCGCLVCLLRCFGCEGADDAKTLADIFVCAVLSCMNTQHNVELNARGVTSTAPPVPGQMGGQKMGGAGGGGGGAFV